MRRLLALGGCWLAFVCSSFAERLPPKPAGYFNDLAGVVPTSTASSLDERLRQFERDTSNQIVVAVFPKMETESSVQDFTYRIAASWGVGQRDRKNGAVLFVFIAERKLYIQVGYGLEAVLPDALCKRIVADEIAPAFKTGRYDLGLAAGVESMIKATRGEYRGSGKTAGDGRGAHNLFLPFIGFFVFLIVLQFFQRSRRGTVYSSSGRGFATGLLWGVLGGLGNSGDAGSNRGGGGDGGGGGGGFSGGGGSFGGGGAGGDW